MRFRSRSADHLCISQRRANNGPQVSQTTRTQFDLSQILADEIDDEPEPLQRSRSAPICSTKIEEEEELKVIPTMEKCVELPERLSTIFESPPPPPSFTDDHEDKLVVYGVGRGSPPPASGEKCSTSHIQTMKLIDSSSTNFADFISPIGLMKKEPGSRLSLALLIISQCTHSLVSPFTVRSTGKDIARLFLVVVIGHQSSKHSIEYSLFDRVSEAGHGSGIDQEEARRHR